MQPTLGLRVDCKSRANPLSTMITAMGMGAPAKSEWDLNPHARDLRFPSPLMTATQRRCWSEQIRLCPRGDLNPHALYGH